jgi:integrase/recombinase XerD
VVLSGPTLTSQSSNSARATVSAWLPSVEHHCGESMVNRKLLALSAFYQHAARSGVDLGELLVTWQPAGRRGAAWRPFLHHITKGQPHARRTVALKARASCRAC